MTVTAQAPAPPRTRTAPDVQAAPPAPPPASSRRRGFTPLTPMRVQAAKSMTKLADHMKETHPDMLAHQHVRDAARMLRSGNEEAAQRHLRAAMFAMTPQSLMRNGLHTDDDHIAARDAMHGIHRHLLLTKDIADTAAKNQAAIRRDSYGDDSSSPPMPQSPVHADPNAGYGPGALAQKPTARQPPGDQALNAPNRAGTGKPDPNVADPAGPQPRGSKQFTTRNGVRAVTELAYDWHDLDAVIEFSAKTAALEVTPAPYGKTGGPGLYGVKGLMHTPYYEQVVKALRGRGMDKGRASAVAYGALRKWAAGGGNVHPEVQAAAVTALAGEKAIGAAAKAVHGHANSWDEVADRVLEFAAVSPAGTPAQPRVPAGQAGGGQFGSGSGQQQAGAKSIASQTASKNVKAKIAANQQAKNKLLSQAAGYRAQADKLIAQRKVLQAELASASGATSSGQSGSTTSAGSSTTSSGSSTTASTAPATTSTAASTTPASTASTTASTSTALTSAQTAQINAQIGQLTTQIVAYQKQYAQAMAQAAKL